MFLIQISHEFERFCTYLPDIRTFVFYGGVNIKVHKELLKNECPHIVVGTPGRILALARDKDLSLKNVRHFILDECDKMLESLGISPSLYISGFAFLFKALTKDLFTLLFTFLIVSAFNICRHEKRCARNFQIDSP